MMQKMQRIQTETDRRGAGVEGEGEGEGERVGGATARQGLGSRRKSRRS
jgi:hypothetical protein